MKSKKIMIGIILLVFAFTFAACTNDNKEVSPEKNDNNMEMDSGTGENMDDMDMDHSSSGDVPKDLKLAENPTYEVGSKAIIETDHMEGMKGAEATIVGAYDTTAYVISYTPTNGGERVENHKWVIQEEIADAGEEPLEPGTEVTINASHMKGMDGATAEIESAEQTTVYMVDYTPTTGGEEVKNHKWVTESELSAE